MPGNPRSLQFLVFLKLMSHFLFTVVHNWSPPFPSGLRFFRPRLWPVRRHSRFHVRGESAGTYERLPRTCQMHCLSHAHRIPLSYHFPGKLSIWILLASVTLFAGLGCFFPRMPTWYLYVLWSLGSCVCCGSVPIFDSDILTAF